MKRSLGLFIALIVLLAVYLIIQKSDSAKVKADRPFVEVDSAKVSSLRFQSSDETVELAKQGEDWKVAQPVPYPAASKTVDVAVGKIATMKRLSLITEKPERFNEFQVGDSAGTKVTVSDGKKQVTFYAGKMSSSGNSYARLDGSNEVWEVSGNNAATFKRKAKDWRDKTITQLEAGTVNKITLRYPDQTITLTREDTTWKVETGRATFVAEKGSVDRITNLLSRMSTVDFADTLPATTFDPPKFELQAELASGEPLNLRLAPKDEEGNQYYLRKTGASADFIIYKSTAQVLMKRPDDFKAKPPEAVKPAGKGKGKA